MGWRWKRDSCDSHFFSEKLFFSNQAIGIMLCSRCPFYLPSKQQIHN